MELHVKCSLKCSYMELHVKCSLKWSYMYIYHFVNPEFLRNPRNPAKTLVIPKNPFDFFRNPQNVS